VKIELLERRLDAAKKQADSIDDLEADLAKARKNEKLLDQQVIQSQEEANQLRVDVAKLQAAAAAGNEKKSKHH
jgi:dynactin 1